jgi:hypothetical protein
VAQIRLGSAIGAEAEDRSDQSAGEEMNVYTAIASVAGKIAKEGIAKDRKNVAQGYQFRGIDDMYNALAPYLAEARLCILPHVLERDAVERTNAKGSVLFFVTVKMQFDFVSAYDGSKHEVVMFGEAMDSGDKATNKAMSAAYKYAVMQTFCIPTEGDNDADATTHEVRAMVPDPEGKKKLETVKDQCKARIESADKEAEPA